MSAPVVYHPNYNISLYGLERLHPFDGHKFSKVLAYLMEAGLLTGVYKPQKATGEQLLLIHTQDYLDSLQYSSNIAAILEVHICKFIPACVLQKVVIDSFLYATGGSILAAQLAAKVFDKPSDAEFQGGFAINLGGGFHHASYDDGQGFCMFSDISMCIAHVNGLHKSVKRFLVIDLDAHQGNGHETDKIEVFSKTDIDIFTIDAYNHDVYPADRKAAKGIDVDIVVTDETTDEVYLADVAAGLEKAKNFCPQFIIYNAGTDILEGDPLGGLAISEAGVIQRDKMIFDFAFANKIPVVYLFSGGYQEVTSKVIFKSLKNLEDHHKIFSNPNAWGKHMRN